MTAKQKTPDLSNLPPEGERCYLVVLGFPEEFNAGTDGDYGLDAAQEYAVALVNKIGGARHATIMVVDKDWRDYTMVAEKIGTVLATPATMQLSGPDTNEDYWEHL